MNDEEESQGRKEGKKGNLRLAYVGGWDHLVRKAVEREGERKLIT